MLGWCSSGFHSNYEGDYSKPCPGAVERFYFEKKGRKEVKVSNGKSLCSCKCHGTVEPTPTKRARRKK